MLRQGVIVAVLVALAGCTSKTSIVGTWKFESPYKVEMFETFNADGTYHEELMSSYGPDDPQEHSQGTYRLEGDRLTIVAVVMSADRPEISRVHSTSTVSILGNTLSIKESVHTPISLHRVDD